MCAGRDILSTHTNQISFIRVSGSFRYREVHLKLTEPAQNVVYQSKFPAPPAISVLSASTPFRVIAHVGSNPAKHDTAAKYRHQHARVDNVGDRNARQIAINHDKVGKLSALD